MRELPKPCVIDANIVLKLFLLEEHSEDAEQFILEAIAQDENLLYVPDLLYVECANVLWQKVRRGHHPEVIARRNLAYLRQMRLPSTPTSDLMERALQLACQCGISAYDACYAALAEQLDLPLLTADERLVGLLAGTGVKVVSLGA